LALEERDVHQMVERQLKGKIWLEWNDGTRLDIGEMIPIRRGFGTKKGRPDTVVWITLHLPVLGVNVRAKYPFLVEVGKAGFADARTDFSSFFETDEIEIPALIVGGAKREERELKYSARTKLNVVQLPFERIPSSD